MLEDNLQQQRDETVKAKNEIKLAKQQHQENKQKSPIKEQEELRRSIDRRFEELTTAVKNLTNNLRKTEPSS